MWRYVRSMRARNAQALEERSKWIEEANFANQVASVRQGGHCVRLYYAADTNKKLRRLEGLVHLEEIVLEGTDVGDAEVRHLLNMPNLKTLVVLGGAITDSGLKELASSTSIETLVLSNTSITDEGLSELKKLTTLRLLILYNAVSANPDQDRRRTDETSKRLKELQQLHGLKLGGIWATKEATQSLPELLPNVNIEVIADQPGFGGSLWDESGRVKIRGNLLIRLFDLG